MKKERRRSKTMAWSLLTLVLLGGSWQLGAPPVAGATECGNAEDPCSAVESKGYDGFCMGLFRLFKLCYDVTYYHLSATCGEGDEDGDDGCDSESEGDSGGGSEE